MGRLDVRWDEPPADLTTPSYEYSIKNWDEKPGMYEFVVQDEPYTINDHVFEKLLWRRKGAIPMNLSPGERWKTSFGKKIVIAVAQNDGTVAYFNVVRICGCGRPINSCYPCSHFSARIGDDDE
jgi:hypothetical protein